MSKKIKKVLHVLAKSPTNSKGGVERHVQAVIAEHAKRGIDSEVIALDKLTTVTPVDGWRYKRAIWRGIWQRRALFRDCSVVQVHDVFWSIIPICPLIADKMYTTFHGWEGAYPVPVKNKLQRWLAAKLSRGTLHVGAWIQEFYWDHPTQITYGGVTLPGKGNDASQTKIAAPRIVFIGRLEEENEVPRYGQLFELLQKTYPDTRITWVGDGALRPYCEQLGKVTGMVEQPIKYLKQADIVFANSYLSMLETQACGKIVCALYSNTLKERYLKTYPGVKHMIASNDIASMNKKISALLSTRSKRTEMEQRARMFAEQMSWKKVANQYLKLWGFDEK